MIIKTPAITVATVDWADHVLMADIQSPASAVDDRTFGAPFASDVVVGNESIVLSCKWSDAFMVLCDGNEETDLAVVITPITGGGTITATCRFAKIPFGQLKIGERAEVDLVMAVTDAIDWTAAV